MPFMCLNLGSSLYWTLYMVPQTPPGQIIRAETAVSSENCPVWLSTKTKQQFKILRNTEVAPRTKYYWRSHYIFKRG